RWSERLAGAVVRAIAGGDEYVVSFASQAEFVARFAADLLHGVAWERWYYNAFAGLRSLPLAEALRTALLDHRADLPAILARLHHMGALEAVLAALEPSALGELWAGMLPPTMSSGEARVFFTHALTLIDALDLWARDKPAPDTMQAYLAIRPAAADWHDRRSLAAALLDVLRFLAAQGYLRRTDTDSNHIDFRRISPTQHERLDRALAALDWLDTDWLRGQVLALIAPSVMPASTLPMRPHGASLPSLPRALLADLLMVMRAHGGQLDRRHPDAASNALRLHTWLLAHNEAWANELLAVTLIERLLGAWHWIAQTPAPRRTLELLRERNVAGALEQLPEPGRAATRAGFQIVADLGTPALALIETLIEANIRQFADVSTRGHVIETEYAGVALLLRAVLDAGMSGLLELAGYPSAEHTSRERIQTLLMALGLRWGGLPTLPDAIIDPGLQLLAGYETQHDPLMTMDDLRARWATNQAQQHAFQCALLRVLLGQRMARGATLHLYHLPLPDGVSALVAGDESAALWPLGRVIHAPEDIAGTISEWSAAWADLTGVLPALVADDRLAPFIGATTYVMPGDDTELATTHHAGRERLLAAHGVLEHGQLGLPDADLTIMLTAIALLRLWARWLRQFGDSSVPYVLKNFVRRAGRISNRPDGLLVELEPLPLDIVLTMSGYTSDLERVPWLNGRRIQFSIRS
ncbi:MAG TPA: hypothetical protein VFT66_25640, partial [Roseiflexaceae bacterium]|nr:hypothetical protein [Roseiflexaceae bacterium]